MTLLHAEGPLRCLRCRAALLRSDEALSCPSCGESFPLEHGIADFAGGEYYDSFNPSEDILSGEHHTGLQLEIEGSRRRISDYYAPLIRQLQPSARRVLDAGCGNGVSVDTLLAENFDAWGNDLSQLRKWQWCGRSNPERLIVASVLRLPFPDDYFDVVISSGVIEHIGVVETPPPHYSVRAVPEQRELRCEFLAELGRVVRRGGRILLDCPNGHFPIDFWHGDSPGSPRFHSLGEHFLPSFAELRRLAMRAIPGARIRAHSPLGRLQFRQASRHRYGRMLHAPGEWFFRLMKLPGARWLAATPLNPFLIVEIEVP